MAGHSKWANIKHKKELNDAKRGALFTKLVRGITMAVKEGGGGDPATNVGLRIAIERAKLANMPRINIERAIAKAIGEGGDALNEVLYEAIGPGGVACIIPAFTDNANRTSALIRNTCEKNGGKMAGQGAVSYMFDRCGIVTMSTKDVTEEKAFQVAEQLEAVEISSEGDLYIITIPFTKLSAVELVLGDIPHSVDTYYRPTIEVHIDQGMAAKVEQFTEALEELEDVEKVYTNETT
ncbi:MAG: putative transcriptional regulatory protein [Microgenomates bacterium OLB22]|nr:MAG: putative transcriptional regulatory protein [Microgenomates bacterium OLB22]